MKKIIVLGAGKIGTLIALWLTEAGDYEVMLADRVFQKDSELIVKNFGHIKTALVDVEVPSDLANLYQKFPCSAVVSCLPFQLNLKVAEFAYQNQLHYFDLTEDVQVTQYVQELSKTATSAFMPQCGLAPGFIGLAANSLMAEFEHVDYAELRVGALPQTSNNALGYALTWSTEGLINEYIKPCIAIKNGKKTYLPALENLEHIRLHGIDYEAFNTSGGVGSLTDLYEGKVQHLNYKTIRYPEHCEKMRFLLNDLRLSDEPQWLKSILEKAIPRTFDDKVVVYISIKGYSQGQYIEKSYDQTILPKNIAGHGWSAIQITTAAGLCGVLDLFFEQLSQHSLKGLILQEQFALKDFLANRFGRVYQANT